MSYDTPKRHTYKGNLICCLECFKKKDDTIHFSLQEKLTVNLVIPVTTPTITPIAQVKSKSEQVNLLQADGSAIVICKGHKCPKCNCTWMHDYTCNSTREGLCKNCNELLDAQINHKNNLPFLQSSLESKQFHPREAMELKLEHHGFVVLNIIHDPATGNLRDNWVTEWTKHYDNLELIIEKCRIKQQSARQAKAEQEGIELTKLTPEEKAQYARDKKKFEAKKEKEQIESTKPIKVMTPNSARDSMIKTLMSSGKTIEEATLLAGMMFPGGK